MNSSLDLGLVLDASAPLLCISAKRRFISSLGPRSEEPRCDPRPEKLRCGPRPWKPRCDSEPLCWLILLRISSCIFLKNSSLDLGSALDASAPFLRISANRRFISSLGPRPEGPCCGPRPKKPPCGPRPWKPRCGPRFSGALASGSSLSRSRWSDRSGVLSRSPRRVDFSSSSRPRRPRREGSANDHVADKAIANTAATDIIPCRFIT